MLNYSVAELRLIKNDGEFVYLYYLCNCLIHVMPSNIMPCITKNEENLFKWKSKKK